MRLRSAAVVLLAGVTGAGIATLANRVEAGPSAEIATGQPYESMAMATTPSGATFDPYMSLAPLVDELVPAVVNVNVKEKVELSELQMHPFFPFMQQLPEELQERQPKEQMREGLGSGFIISDDGYILTNNHVIDGADEVTVTLSDETTLDARVVGTDSRTDIALIKVESDRKLPTVSLGDSSALRVGDRVVAIGNPFGLSHTVTTGIVSAKGRVIGAGPYDDFIQTDASINPGNSGGPLFDLHGRVVGINTAIVRSGQGIAWSVPIDMVTDVLDELKANGRVARGWMGIGLKDVDADLALGLGIDGDTEGVLVTAVYPGMPAAEAGLEPGDVIVGLDGEEVEASEEIIRAVGFHRPGDEVKLDLLRDGKKKKVDVTLGERPEEEALRKSGFWNDGPESGSPDEKAAPKTTALADLGVRVADKKIDGKQGVVVLQVARSSQASGLLQPGDRLVEVNRKRIKTSEDVDEALAKGKGTTIFLIERDGAEMIVPVPTED